MCRFRGCVCAGILFTFLCIGLSFAGAAVTVSVSEFVLLAEDNDPIYALFTIHNGDPEAIMFELHVVDWMLAEGSLTTMLPPGTIGRSCADWITTEVRTYALDPDQDTDIGIQVSPSLLHPGTFWCGLLLRVRSASDSDVSGITALREFLVKILVTVPSANPMATVRAVEPRGMNPLVVVAEFENTGDAYLQNVEGWMVLEDAWGEELARLGWTPFNSLPGGVTRLSATWDRGLQEPGIYLVRAVFDTGGERLLAGEAAFRVSELDLAPVPGAANPPTDLDGDGLYEDIDGDGMLGVSDINALSTHLEHAALQRNARAFDFNNDGVLDFLDAHALQDIVSQHEI